MRRLTPGLALLLALLGVGSLAAPASAHASLVTTDPVEGEVLAEAPKTITFTFDETVSLVPDGVAMFDAAGEPVEISASARDAVVTAEPEADLADGTYVVTWRIVSDDGHPVAGSLTFHIGERSASVVPPQVAPTSGEGAAAALLAVASAIDYLALFLLGGLVLFLTHTTAGVRLRPEVRRRLVRLLQTAAATAALSALLLVPLAGAYQQGMAVWRVITPAAWDLDLVGEDVLVAVLQLVGAAAALLLARRAPTTVRQVPLTLALLVALAVWSPALVGHTRAYAPSGLLVITDAVHLTAGAVWLGGLVGLALVLGSVRGRARDAALLLARFSTVAATALLALAVTGTLLGWRILGSLNGLLDTGYGRLLLVKLGLALVVAATAAWNRYRLLPAVSRGGHDQQRRVVGLVRRAVLAEATLLVAILAVTGFLVEQAPGGTTSTVQPADTGVVAAQADDYRVLAVLDAAVGQQRVLTLQVQDETGEPVDLYAAPTLSVASADGDLDLGDVPLVPVAAGSYTAELVLPESGTWTLRVGIRIDEFTNPVTTLEVEVGD